MISVLGSKTYFALKHSMEILANSIGQEMEINGMQVINEEISLSFFLNAMVVYVENPKEKPLCSL